MINELIPTKCYILTYTIKYPKIYLMLWINSTKPAPRLRGGYEVEIRYRKRKRNRYYEGLDIPCYKNVKNTTRELNVI